jgi:ATP-dependent Lon protease
MTSPRSQLPTSLPLLPLRSGAILPGTRVALPVGRARSLNLVETLRRGDWVIVAAQRDAQVEEPALGDLYEVATLARVVDVAPVKDKTYRIVLEGVDRVKLDTLTATEPFWRAETSPVAIVDEDPPATLAKAQALAESLAEHLARVGSEVPDITDPGRFADLVAAGLGLPGEKEIEILGTLDLNKRLDRVASLVGEAEVLADVKRKVEGEVREKFSKNQREAVLREQLRAIQKELGEGDEDDDGLAKLKARLDEVGLPEEARKVVDRELRRLASTNGGQAEGNVIRTYLELIADLPWSARAPENLDLDAVAKKLDEDHDGLEEVKKRILEHMAVLKLSKTPKATILALHGPPGVGKTSLGQSIADATGRPLVRIALGGVRDEADIRGHRRTYIGALPGRILHALRKAKVKNPIILLDEIDKLGRGVMGSPEAALLEVLDPEQNATFTDHYLELPFDLSEVTFLCTANSLETLTGPLLDRLEIIDVPGYTTAEKLTIARRHLVPKELGRHGVPEGLLTIDDGALLAMIRDYTREAGVRQLTREIAKLCRAAALSVSRSPDEKPQRLAIDEGNLAAHLGKVRFFADVAERTSVPGVATGLAWTPVGGDILFIETSRMPGKGAIEITGQLGDVMKESARAALTFVRSHADELGIDARFLATEDLHIHVPQGAVPKDGPSAGVTMFTALASLLSGRRVRPDTAMTGEATLRGKVLPVGGIKSKVLAAHRAGIRQVILPKKNERDIDDIPEEVRNQLRFVFASDMTEVLAAALEPEGVPQVTGLPAGAPANGGSSAAA